jgi:PPM family protein phosphatase
MRAVAAGVTDVGKERDHNEDRFVLLPEFDVYVVADGMGGHQCGEVASRMATSTIASYFRAHKDARNNSGPDGAGPMSDVLRASLLEANSRIHRRAKMSSAHRGMGTTVVAAAFHRDDQTLYVAHAGDSRCYLLRDQELYQLTRDHSLLEEAMRTRPDISRSELAYLPANVITRALGVEPTVDVEVTSHRVQLRDVYLLCSDGLHGFVADEKIREILQTAPILTNACVELVAEANRNGGGDNITAVLVRIEEVDEPWAVPKSVPPAKSRSTAPVASASPGEQGATLTSEEAAAQMKQSGLPAEEAKKVLEADDTAKVAAITDADAILAGVKTE